MIFDKTIICGQFLQLLDCRIWFMIRVPMTFLLDPSPVNFHELINLVDCGVRVQCWARDVVHSKCNHLVSVKSMKMGHVDPYQRSPYIAPFDPLVWSSSPSSYTVSLVPTISILIIFPPQLYITFSTYAGAELCIARRVPTNPVKKNSYSLFIFIIYIPCQFKLSHPYQAKFDSNQSKLSKQVEPLYYVVAPPTYTLYILLSLTRQYFIYEWFYGPR